MKQCSECYVPRKGGGGGGVASSGSSSPMMMFSGDGGGSSKNNTVGSTNPRKNAEKKTNRPTTTAAAVATSWASSSSSSSGGGGGGIRMPQTFVPPEFVNQISQQPRRNNMNGRTYCKFSTCEKFGRPTLDGFCFSHFNMFSLDSSNIQSEGVNTTTTPSQSLTFSSTAPVSFENVPEITLLERTRNNLLNGRDCWICIDCAIEVPSIAYPCGQCRKMISFVPLMMYEFEEFVKKQREINMTRRQRNTIGGA